MKIVISIVALIVVLYGAFAIWEYWDKVSHDRDVAEKEEAAKLQINPDSLPGMPPDLQNSFGIAQKNGPVAVGKWLKVYGSRLDDPRRAWIELDYMVGIAREDPKEAKRIFADVKGRTPENSPVYPRIKQLEKTYE